MALYWVPLSHSKTSYSDIYILKMAGVLTRLSARMIALSIKVVQYHPDNRYDGSVCTSTMMCKLIAECPANLVKSI